MRVMERLLSHGANLYSTFSKHIQVSGDMLNDEEAEERWITRSTTGSHEIMSRSLCAKPIFGLPSLDLEARDADYCTLLLAASKSYSINQTTVESRQYQKAIKNALHDLIDSGTNVTAKGRTIPHHLKSPYTEAIQDIFVRTLTLLLSEKAVEAPLHYVVCSHTSKFF
ncbi:hypothetical protein N7495_009369 [Penicillium taxi]|uniref:uncharacterized protein n=1 Tax=Penicillium taxi TaxID=168475 RepID=UPI0025451CE7|nr:uncharacterized protein N7495_009369 [Penicillium taxi]KAJ5884859.1 hypothetical protein N7495_009369 [Penicillium taxi]